MLKTIWIAEYDRYVSEDNIRRFWKKADILSETWDADTNNEVCKCFSSWKGKTQVSAKLCDELCDLMKEVQLKAYYTGVDTIGSAKVFENSFVNDNGISS